MIVCICNRVSDKDIKKCIEQGCGFSQIQQQTGACTNCAMCKDEIVWMIEQFHECRVGVRGQPPPLQGD